MKKRTVTARLIVGIVVALGTTGCEVIDPGTVGVEVCWGTAERVLYEGTHYTGFCGVEELSTRTQEYTMAGNVTPEVSGSGRIQALTKDQLSVGVEVTTQYHLTAGHALAVFRAFGDSYSGTIIQPMVRAAIRDAVSDFTAVDLVDQRPQVQRLMERVLRDRLTRTLRGRGIPVEAIRVDNLLLRNIDLPQSLDDSIAAVQRQRQQAAERTQARQTAEQEALRARIEAQALADRARIEAEGQATSLLTRARAQAEANRLVAGSITQELIRLRQVEAMHGILSSNQTRIVMMPSGQGTIFNLGNLPTTGGAVSQGVQ